MRSIAVLSAALLFVLLAGIPVEASTWTVPGTVNAGGLNNTRFVSDLAVTNPGSVAAQATISFVPANGTTPRQVTLGAGETVAYRNVLDRLWGAQGAGATQVTSDVPLLIRARTYNTAASGTYGVALPVFADDRLLSAGESADSLWISQSADGTSGYRTNVAVVFPDEEGGEAAVTVYDANGVALGSQEFSLDTPGFQQFGAGFAGSVAVARAEIQVVRGRAAAYSVVVDNVTGDSSLFTFEALPAGRQDVLVNGVARSNGKNNTFFRTDGRFFNPSEDDALVKVSFHASGASNPSPVARTFTVGGGKILDVVDVLGSLLDLPVGSAGAVRFESDLPLAILCRTSNVDPFGVKPGTYGAQQKPTPLLSFLMSADAGAVVTGIRQSATFRTNVGFAAGPDGGAYFLTLRNTSGATVMTTTGSLGVFGWTQPNVQDLFPTVPIPDDATLEVKVTSGSVDVFDSSIDNASGDPVVTPVMPLPADIPQSAVIGSSGGAIRSSDGTLTLRVPAGALGAPTPMSIGITTNEAPGALGSGYDLSPAGLSFAKPAVLSLRYGTGTLPAEGIDGVAVAVLAGAGWAALTGGQIDTSSRSLLIRVRSTSPADVPAAARTTRTALKVPSSSRLGANQAIAVRVPEWLPTKGKLPLQVDVRTTPSSAGSEFTYEFVGAVLNNVTVKWAKPSSGSLDSTTRLQTNYTAPSRIAHVYVPVASSVTVNSKANRPALVKFGFNLIRRNFKFRASYTLDIRCGGSNDVSLKSFDPEVSTQPRENPDPEYVVNNFRFSDDLSFHPDLPIPGNLVACSLETCRAAQGCMITAVTGVPHRIELNNLLGRFQGASGFFMTGALFQKQAFPGYEESCPYPLSGGSEGVDLDLPIIGGVWTLSDKIQNFETPANGGVVIRFDWSSIDADIP